MKSKKNFDSLEDFTVFALQFLKNDENTLSSFITQTGFGTDDIIKQVRSAYFQEALLDFLLEDDQRIIAFCTSLHVDPNSLLRLHATLPSNTTPHWT